MLNSTLQYKIQQRLNKLGSNDYLNIECGQIVEAFNKAQTEWCRRNARGANSFQEGADQSTSRIDDLQKLLPSSPPTFTLKKFSTYFESVESLPVDYLRFSRFIVTAITAECKTPRIMRVWLGEEANVDIYLDDKTRQPNFPWSETFAVIKNNKILVYTNGEFEVSSLALSYYRQPIKIRITGCKDPYTADVPIVDVTCEFNDDLTELIIDDAAAILAGDTENMLQQQRLSAEAEKNN